MPTINVPVKLNEASTVFSVLALWETRDGSAISGRDYTAANGYVVFEPGEVEKNIQIQVNQNAYEGEFFIDLTVAGGAAIDKSTSTVSLTNALPPPDVLVMMNNLWDFIYRATGSRADDANIPPLVTAEGLVKNNQFYGGALGGYTPDGTASSEGNSLMMRGVAAAYQVDQDPEKLDYCKFLMDSTITHFFRGEVPTSTPNTTWNHHWLVNAGEPFNVRGPLRYADQEIDPLPRPIVSIAPSSIQFGATTVNHISPQYEIVITNSGTADLTISDYDIDDPFALIGDVPSTIPPNSSASVYLNYQPVAVGSNTGVFRIYTNTSAGSQTVSLQGTGEAIAALSYLTADGSKLKDESGEEVMLRSINWYGFEQIGLPMGAWTRPFRTKIIDGVVKEGMLDEIKRIGFNSLRILVSEDVTWPGYKPTTTFGQWNTTFISPQLNPEFLNDPNPQNPQDVKDTIEIMDTFVDWCEELGLRIVFDLHCLAPDDDNVLATNGKWYTTATPTDPGSTAGVKREPRNEQQAIDALVFLADRYKNRPVVCGFDLINEPHATTWDRDPLTGVVGYYERCGNAIHEVNPNVLIICEGVSELGMNNGTVDHTPLGHEQDPDSQQGKYKWGTVWSGKLDEIGRVNNVHVTLETPNKIVYSPHEYFSWPGTPAAHQWFYPEQYVGSGYAGLPFPYNMPDVWYRQWGYLAEENIAPVWIGEFGSYYRVGGDPVGGGGASYNSQHLAFDKAVTEALASYCNEHSIGFAYWAWNPGGNPDGLLSQQPMGTWHDVQQFKMDIIRPFLVPDDSATIQVTPTTLDFTDVEVGQSKTLSLTVTNSSSSTIQVTAAASLPYTLNKTSANVPGSGFTVFDVTFTPLVEGEIPGSVNFQWPGGLRTTSVTGNGVEHGSTGPDINLPSNAVGVTAVGDSLTWFGFYENNGWLYKATFYDNQRHRFRGVHAVIGSTSSDALNSQLPLVLAMNPPPKACFVATGTNNVYDTANGVQDVKDICQSLIDHNIWPVLWTVPPRNDTTGSDNSIATWNNLIRAYAAETGIPLLDAHTAMLQPGTTNRLNPDYDYGDGLHFNKYGLAHLGEFAKDSDAWAKLPSDGPYPLATATGSGNVIPNPLFVDSNADGVSNNLTLAAGFSGQILSGATDGIPGNWQRIIRPGNVVGNLSNTLSVVTVTGNTTYRVACRIRWNTNGTRSDTKASWTSALSLLATTENWDFIPNSTFLLMGTDGRSQEEGVAIADVKMPASATRLLVSLFVLFSEVTAKDTDTTIDFAQLSVTPLNLVPGPTSGITITPSTLSFGEVDVGDDEIKSLNISNTTDAGVTVNFTATGDFTVTPPSITVAKSSASSVVVKFTPTVAGNRPGTVSATWSGGSKTTPVSGIGREVSDSTFLLGEDGSFLIGEDGASIIAQGDDALSPLWLSTDGSKIVDGNGEEVILQSLAWDGFSNDGVVSGLWGRPYKTIVVGGTTHEGLCDQIKRLGFNSVRLPVSQDFILGYANRLYSSIDPELNPDLFTDLDNPWTDPQPTIPPLEVMDKIVNYLTSLDIRVIFDMHSATRAYNPSNEGKWYTTANPGDTGSTNGTPGEPRSEQQWISAWVAFANRYKDNPMVCGFDLFNEPWDCTWTNNPNTGWPAAVERCANAIHEVNPNLLIVVEGITGNVEFQPGKEWPSEWGANLSGVRNRPISINIPNKVVYSPHEYWSHAPWVPVGQYRNQWYTDPDYPNFLPDVWRSEWGYLVEENIAPVWIGEFGTSFEVNTIQNPAYTSGNLTKDTQYKDKWVAYLRDNHISWDWWYIQPSQSPTAHLLGLLDVVQGAPVSNTFGEARSAPMSIINELLAPLDPLGNLLDETGTPLLDENDESLEG